MSTHTINKLMQEGCHGAYRADSSGRDAGLLGVLARFFWGKAFQRARTGRETTYIMPAAKKMPADGRYSL